jgi:hypothetical protein
VIVKADHIAGGAFVALGIFVFVIGTDLPFGTLSGPGAGFMPKLVAALMIVFALAIMSVAATETKFKSIDWSDWRHAALVVMISATGIALYQKLGFLITMTLLVFTLLVVVERRNVLRAAAYSAGLTLFAYWLFGKALKAPLERGLFWL